MPTQGSAPLSSQGQDYGISGAYKISIKKTRASSGQSKNDISDLSIVNGGERVYEDGLEDPGQGGSADGITTTVTVSTYGQPPATGDEIAFDGVNCKCVESETTNDTGKPVEGTATFTSDFTS